MVSSRTFEMRFGCLHSFEEQKEVEIGRSNRTETFSKPLDCTIVCAIPAAGCCSFFFITVLFNSSSCIIPKKKVFLWFYLIYIFYSVFYN